MEAESKDTAASARRSRKAKRAYLILAVVAAVVAGLWIVHREMTKGKQDTDDAQVEADVVPLAARVGGVVAKVSAHDNQLVKAGEPLFDLDTTDLQNEVDRTAAELEAAEA